MFKYVLLSAVGICYGVRTAKRRGLQPFTPAGSNYGTMANTMGATVDHKRSPDDAGNKRVENSNGENIQHPRTIEEKKN
jgi:hypothetical protein